MLLNIKRFPFQFYFTLRDELDYLDGKHTVSFLILVLYLLLIYFDYDSKQIITFSMSCPYLVHFLYFNCN